MTTAPHDPPRTGPDPSGTGPAPSARPDPHGTGPDPSRSGPARLAVPDPFAVPDPSAPPTAAPHPATAPDRVEVTAGEAREVVRRLLAGYPRDRDAVADALTGAQHAGRPEFGLDLLARELRGPAARRAAVTVTAASAPAVRCLDGTDAPGPVAVAHATRLAGELAEASGVGLVAARGVTGAGRLAPYAARAARRGLVVLLCAQAPPSTAPHGGSAPVLGTNPLAYALPRADGGVLVADAATAALTQAELADHRRRGLPLPPGRALDAGGSPTTDPAAVAALLPSGGLLGTLVGLLVEALAGALPDARGPAARGRGVLCVAVDPGALGAGPVAPRVEELAVALTAAGGRAPGALERPVPDGAVLEVAGDVWRELTG
ncbi:Ldh family oxidoreductase [Streptomyces sp. JNUCC 64]